MFDGQSLGLIPGAPNNYPTVTMQSFPTWAWTNVHIGAMSWTQLAATQTGRCHVHANTGLVTVLVMCGGTSDIYVEQDSGATCYADHVAYADAARAAGFDLVVATTLVKADGYGGGAETRRTDFNTLLLADASNAFDAVADFAADPSLDDPTDTTYYLDGIHWKIAGAAAAAACMVPVLQSLGL